MYSERIAQLKAELADLLDKQKTHVLSSVPNDLFHQTRALNSKIGKIEAIIHYRNVVGCSLQEAKVSVEVLLEES